MISETSSESDAAGFHGVIRVIPVRATINRKNRDSENVKIKTPMTKWGVKVVSIKYFIDILANLRKSCDTSIRVVCGNYTEYVNVNRCILEAISPDLSRMLGTGCVNQGYTKVDLELDNLGFNTRDFLNLIDFIYTGKIVLTLENLENMLRVAGTFKVHVLIDLCKEYIKSILDIDTCVPLLLVLCKNDTAVRMTKGLAAVKIAIEEQIRVFIQGFVEDHKIYEYSSEDIVHLLQCNCFPELKEANVALQFANRMIDRCLEKKYRDKGIECLKDQHAVKAAELAISILLEDINTMLLHEKKSLHLQMLLLHVKARQQFGIYGLFNESLRKLVESIAVEESVCSIDPSNKIPKAVSQASSSPVTKKQSKLTQMTITQALVENFGSSTKENKSMKTVVKTFDKAGIDERSKHHMSKIKGAKTKQNSDFKTFEIETIAMETKGNDHLKAQKIKTDMTRAFDETLSRRNVHTVDQTSEKRHRICIQTSDENVEQVTGSCQMPNNKNTECEEMNLMIEYVKDEPDERWTNDNEIASIEAENEYGTHAFGDSNALELIKCEERNDNGDFYKCTLEKEQLTETHIKVEKVEDDGVIDHMVIKLLNQENKDYSFNDFGEPPDSDAQAFVPIIQTSVGNDSLSKTFDHNQNVCQEVDQSEILSPKLEEELNEAISEVYSEKVRKTLGPTSETEQECIHTSIKMDLGRADLMQKHEPNKKNDGHDCKNYSDCNVPVKRYLSKSDKREETGMVTKKTMKRKLEQDVKDHEKDVKEHNLRNFKGTTESTAKVIIIPKCRFKKVVIGVKKNNHKIS